MVRPEVKLLEYPQVPGITQSSSFFLAQRIISSKRQKITESKSSFLFFRFFIYFLFIFLDAAAGFAPFLTPVPMSENELSLIKDALSNHPIVHDPAVLQAQVQTMESDLLAKEMRLRYSFSERNRKAGLLAEFKANNKIT